MTATATIKLTPAQSKLVEDHMDIVPKIVNALMRKLPAHVDRSDFVSEGYVGLVNAAKNFSPDAGTEFSTWANTKIASRVRDEMRSRDAGTRTMRKNQRVVEEAEAALSLELGRKPKEKEVAKACGLSEKKLAQHRFEYYAAITPSMNFTVVSDDDEAGELGSLIADEGFTPETSVMAVCDNAILRSAISKLDDRSRLIVELYHFDELKLHEISPIVELTESRISQLLSKAMKSMKAEFTAATELAVA